MAKQKTKNIFRTPWMVEFVEKLNDKEFALLREVIRSPQGSEKDVKYLEQVFAEKHMKIYAISNNDK